MPVTSSSGWSSITWWPASGISITGATRPSRLYISPPMSCVTRPFSARNRATRQCTLCSTSGAGVRLPNTFGSNFQVQPPSTEPMEFRAMCSITYGRVCVCCGTVRNRASASDTVA